jgi:hypothetical protein
MSDTVSDMYDSIQAALGPDKTVAYKAANGGYIHEAMEALKREYLEGMVWDFDLDEQTRITALMISQLYPNS